MIGRFVGMPGTLMLDAGAIESQPWRPIRAHTGSGRSRWLWEKGDDTEWISVTEMAPGMRGFKHLHLGAVFGYTLSGRWRYLEEDWIAGPGSLIHEAAGSVHTFEVVGDEPVTAVWHRLGPQIYLNDDDTPLDPADEPLLQEALRAFGAARA